ncbi:MAG: hypothetical protein QXG68_07640 [Candidatus Bathyarchaeia archaeon]
MDKKKTLIGLSATAIILLSLLAPMLYVQPVVADSASDYKTVKGVLDSDYYVLYPFEKNSLTIGFSKYGEFINPFTGDGLNYSGRDPFANEGVDMKYWVNGWFLDLRYVHRTYGARHIWAMATFADMANYGGDWLNEHTDPYGPPYGGRKCSAVATTEPITVLYDGPRLFVAKLVTHIKDKHGALTWPVVDVIFTIVFEKVKKQVIVFKDVKLTIDSKVLASPVNVQFSNRGEWDLGPSPDWKSYAHFFHQEFDTCYNASWHLQKVITREYKYYSASFTGTIIDLDYVTESEPDWDVPIAYHSEYIYVDDVWMKRGVDYTINYNTGVVTFSQALNKAKVEIYFKLHKVDGNGEPIALPHLYDVAQIISRDKKVVGYAAFWPVLSDYTVDGWDYCLEPLYGITMTDMESEPDIPFVIGEWDFLLDYDEITPDWGEQFRGVTVYGIVNYHDADDMDIGTGHNNVLDREIKYLLNEVFNPWDLRSAVHKETMRFVKIETKTVTATTRIDYEVGVNAIISKQAHTGGIGNPSGTSWYDYCNATERVIVDGVLISPEPKRAAPYYNATLKDGVWYINVTIPAGTHTIKILWSNYTTPGRYEWVVVGRDAETVDSAGAALVTSAFKDKIIESNKQAGAYIGLAGADMKEIAVYNAMPSVMHKFGTGNTKADYKDMIGRAALKDDWCTTWPVASSSMIAVGGPLANMLAYYANDFTPAFFGLEEYAASVWDNKIIALTCWSKNTYESTEDTGYAVVATYKDLNGTVIFLVWGHWGRDTYYATKWLHEEGIYQLQSAPRCATAIILEIDYTVHEPAVSIVEVLGTISETLWTHNDVKKGGIHPDP